jgi:4-amino-4-deoxy-L-arabinose transferase-like glycosyltransferase
MRNDERDRTFLFRDVPFLLILAAGIALRFIALGQQSFWYDEIDSVTTVLAVEDRGWDVLALNAHGPLYLIALKGWMGLVGQGESAVRALSAIIGSLGLYLFYRVSVRFIGRKASLIALALVAFSPFHLRYSQYARNYVLLVNMGLLAVPAMAVEVERRTKGTFLLAFAAIAATCLTNLSGFFLFVLFGIYALVFRRPSRYPVRRLALFFVLSAALLWPWVLEGTKATGRFHLGRPEDDSGVPAVKGEAPPGLLSVPFTFYNFSVGYSLGPSSDELKIRRFPGVVPHLWYLLPAAVLFGAVTIRGLLRIGRPVRLVLLLWLAVPVLMMLALSVFNLKAPNSRYAFLAFAPYLFVVAAGVHSIKHRALKASVLALLLFYMGCSDYRYFTDSRYRSPDVKSAGELISRRLRPDDVVVAYAQKYIRFYLPRDINLLKPPDRFFSGEDAMEDWLRRNTADAERVWIVPLRGWWVDRENRFPDVCRRLLIQQGEWRFTSLPIYLFETPEDWGPE